MQLRPRTLAVISAVFALSIVLTSEVGAQARAGGVTGIVTDAQTGRPLSGVSVMIAGTSYGGVTSDAGRYTILNIARGIYSVEVRRLGYGAGRRENVRLADSIVRVDFALRSMALRLEAVTVSGTVDPIAGTRIPFTVAKLTAEDLPVTTTSSAAGAIQGKIAGAKIIKTGGPGAGVFVQLRSPTSQFKSNAPLYVIDGVILNSQVVTTTADIESLDIASIEVIKGASAAAMYGPRAADGVISITTNRGNTLALNTTQFNARSEMGVNQFTTVPRKPTHHQFLVDAAGNYVNALGVIVPRSGRVVRPDGIMDTPYKDPLFDQPSQFFRAGSFRTAQLAIQQSSAATNFAFTYNRYAEQGTVLDALGITRQNVRLNLDHRVRDDFSVNTSIFYNKAFEDPATVSFTDFYSFAADVDLARANLDGSPYLVIPDSTSTRINPLYRQRLNDDVTRRARTFLSTNVSYKPRSWLSVDGQVGYDKSYREQDQFTPRGMISTDGITPTLGEYVLTDDNVDGISGTLGSTATQQFRDITARVTVRAQQNRETNQYFDATGTDFSIIGIKDMGIAKTRAASSSFTDRRSSYVMGNLGLDYMGKIVGDFLLRRDGNSLYGPNSRYNNFYRASVAYLLSQESWWPLASVGLFKVRGSVGSAGTSPDYADQYEDLTLASGGGVTRGGLGNTHLRPEVVTERELGIDAIVRGNTSFQLNYVTQTTHDNIIAVPVAALFGFNTQNRNVGTVQGRTVEATIQTQLIQRPNFTWESNIVLDQSRTTLVAFNRSCYSDGILNRCEGANLDDMWGNTLITSPSQLRPIHLTSQDQFQLNDDGWLVPVGSGNTFRDGRAKNLWGTTVVIDGISYPWGRPILERDSVGNATYKKIGHSLPDLNFGLGNRFRFKSVQLYGLLTGQIGGNIYNAERQSLYSSTANTHPDFDQASKADELRKPVSYYSTGLRNGGAFTNAFVEDGTYAKLSELSLKYSLPTLAILQKTGADKVAIEVIGRNVWTWTKSYSGIDPEAGTPLQRSATITYPLYRTWTAALNLTF